MSTVTMPKRSNCLWAWPSKVSLVSRALSQKKENETRASVNSKWSKCWKKSETKTSACTCYSSTVIFLHTAKFSADSCSELAFSENLFNCLSQELDVYSPHNTNHESRDAFIGCSTLGLNKGRPSTPNILQELTVDQTADPPHTPHCTQ